VKKNPQSTKRLVLNKSTIRELNDAHLQYIVAGITISDPSYRTVTSPDGVAVARR
jgi:hypothetical protein